MNVRTRRFLNDPARAVEEMLEGYAAAHAGVISLSDGLVVRAVPKAEGKVGVVIGNGSGHEPAMIGWVGEGLFDVNVAGPIFSSPGPTAILEGIRAADRGAGVLLLVSSHAGDIMNAELAIDDADIENACMQFIPGSHRRGELKHHASDPAEDNVLYRTAEATEIQAKPVHVELKAGEISLHSDLLLHGSPRNNSNRRRCGLTMRYASTDVIAHEGWNQGSILCCGVDAEGNWVDIQRPDKEVV